MELLRRYRAAIGAGAVLVLALVVAAVLVGPGSGVDLGGEDSASSVREAMAAYEGPWQVEVEHLGRSGRVVSREELASDGTAVSRHVSGAGVEVRQVWDRAAGRCHSNVDGKWTNVAQPGGAQLDAVLSPLWASGGGTTVDEHLEHDGSALVVRQRLGVEGSGASVELVHRFELRDGVPISRETTSGGVVVERARYDFSDQRVEVPDGSEAVDVAPPGASAC